MRSRGRAVTAFLVVARLSQPTRSGVHEAVERSKDMSSAGWWEAHHRDERMRPGTSWFGPISRRFIDAYASAPRKTRRCALAESAVVLGAGFSRSTERLAATGLFSSAVGVDASRTAVDRMRKTLRPDSRARYLNRDALDTGLRTASAAVVLDEGILDLLQGDSPQSHAPTMRRFLREAGRLVSPRGGLLAVVGFSGDPAIFDDLAHNGSFDLGCWTRTLFRSADGQHHLTLDYAALSLDTLRRRRIDPRFACSPFSHGLYLLCRRREDNMDACTSSSRPLPTSASSFSSVSSSSSSSSSVFFKEVG